MPFSSGYRRKKKKRANVTWSVKCHRSECQLADLPDSTAAPVREEAQPSQRVIRTVGFLRERILYVQQCENLLVTVDLYSTTLPDTRPLQ